MKGARARRTGGSCGHHAQATNTDRLQHYSFEHLFLVGVEEILALNLILLLLSMFNLVTTQQELSVTEHAAKDILEEL